MTKTEVLIIGGGIPGLTLALLLGRIGIEVCVVDTEKMIAMDEVETTGRTSAIMSGSVNILKSAGIWDLIANETEALKTLRIVDDSNQSIDPIQVDFFANDIGLSAFGYNTPNAKLRAVLCQEIEDIKTITHIAPARLTDYTLKSQGSGVIATLDNGDEIEARLIIGADGRNSVVRQSAHIQINKKDYGQSAITCVIEHTKDHENISTEFHRPGGPFTTVPMPGGHTSSIVWMEKTEDAQRYIALDKNSFITALQDRTRNMLGTVSLKTTPESWPIITQNVKTLIGARCALMAEAAHVLSPIGAQGLNLSLRDVAALAETITDAMRLGQDIGSSTTLHAYEQKRRLDINSRVYGVDILNRAVGNNLNVMKGLRRAGLKSIDGIPALKEAAMIKGLAPAMADSRLMRAESL